MQKEEHTLQGETCQEIRLFKKSKGFLSWLRVVALKRDQISESLGKLCRIPGTR
jgi:hypothetical protein